MIKLVSPKSWDQLTERDGLLVTENGESYRLNDGIPELIYPKNLLKSDEESVDWYRDNADVYDDYLPLTFATFGCDELVERRRMIEKLDLQPTDAVLETGCGTGRDSLLIAEKLGADGELHMHDLSYDILKHAVPKFKAKSLEASTIFCLSNASYLPYEDNMFDKAFHFGGLNTFGEKRRALEEMARVVKPGGRIVVGDENMPTWLRETEFGKVLMNSNPHYRYDLPLECIPISAREVSIEWIIGGVFYVISFVNGSAEPEADLDFEIPGPKGGTHRTRYYGQISGLDEETLELARRARAAKGESMSAWLNRTIKNSAEQELND